MTRNAPPNRGPRVTFLALLLVYLPYLYAFWVHLSGREISVTELMLYPLLLGGAEVALILILIRYVFRERVGELNRKPGRWITDIASGVLLCVVSFALMIAYSVLLAPFLPQRSGPPPAAVETLFRALTESRLLLVLWLGPVVWIGVAAFEELSRVFLLDRLWELWPGASARWATVLLSAVMWGLVHIYQGFSSVVSISLLGLIYALYYMRFGRVWPLIIAHALFDSLQILQAVRAGGGESS
jgi:membrane protease YdiL (CAAX protease family)